MPITPVEAGLVENDRVIETEQTAVDRATVDNFIKREDVRRQFELLGVDPAEAEKRVAALSDEQVARLAGQIKDAPAGQGAIGVIVGAAVLIFLVLLVTDLLGFTSVFSFTKKGSANPS
ncbi:MAG: hypothetical protein COW30_01195 [Rhodospirillales bacterium CG15_BIG_FIL_POST_REV_8_21_14_020_66_15]|nr:MAG: hypothetical protein COW30_01195 [Rhodospirillales bacterium CG15_BIG_FIL_POST_REV_8_21_14_020_66_15]